MWANDTLINIRNATPQDLEIRNTTTDRGWGGSSAVLVRAGTEPGFAAGLMGGPQTDAYLWIRFPWQESYSYGIWCENHEVGVPDVRIYWQNGRDWQDISGQRDMRENWTFELTHRGYRFHVHRWSNGKEPLDDYDEWYTRFFVTMSLA